MVRPALVFSIVFAVFIAHLFAGTNSGTLNVGVRIGDAPNARAPTSNYTWGAAAVSVTQAGFANLKRLEKTDLVYWFAAERDGDLYHIAVSISSGSVLEVIRS